MTAKIVYSKINSKFLKSNMHSYVANPDLWRNYIKGINHQVDDLGWRSVWGKEHTQRGVLINALAPFLHKGKKHMHIEYQIQNKKNQGRIDLMISSNNKKIDELWELKSKENFISIDLNLEKMDTLKSIESITASLIKSHNEWHDGSAKDQVKQYIRILEDKTNDFVVKDKYIIFFSKIVLRPENLTNNNFDNLKFILAELKSSLDRVNLVSNVAVCFYPINSSLITSKLIKEKNYDITPFFKANKNSSDLSKVLKLYSGALISISKVL